MRRTAENRNRYSMKRVLPVVLAVMMAVSTCIVMAGCDSGQGADSTATKTVTDCSGRKAEVPEDPQRVACLYATAAHMMAMLDEQDKIVGCPNGVKSDVLMQMKYPEITDTATPHQEGSINTEELLRTKTDLALISYSLSQSPGELEKLDEAGIPYAVIEYTNLDELKNELHNGGFLKAADGSGPRKRISRLEESCYVCNRIFFHFSHMAENIIYLWDKDPDFPAKLNAQPYFCLPHYRLLLEYGQLRLPKKKVPEFAAACAKVVETYLDTLRGDIDWFCKKFDYRYEEEPWYNSKDAVERTIRFLRSDLHGTPKNSDK